MTKVQAETEGEAEHPARDLFGRRVVVGNEWAEVRYHPSRRFVELVINGQGVACPVERVRLMHVVPEVSPGPRLAVRTVKNWCDRGRLKHENRDGVYLIDREGFVAFCAEYGMNPDLPSLKTSA